jgi:hypothetical protein
MQISVVSYEKHRNSALEAAEQEYIKRLSRQARVALCPGKAQGGLPDRLLKGTYVVGLCTWKESRSPLSSWRNGSSGS